MRGVKIFLALCFFVLGAFGANAATLGDSKLGSSLRKECKKTVKQLKKEGWAVSGASQSLDDAMEAHFVAVEEAGLGALIIEGRSVGKTVNIAVRKAMTNASSQYVSMKASEVEGHTSVNITNEVGSEATTQTRMDAVYVSSSSESVKAFTPTVSLYRQLPDGTFEAKLLYVVTK